MANNDLETGKLSARGRRNVDTVIPRIPRTILEAGNVSDEDVIDMSLAENWLTRDETIELQRLATQKALNPETLSWPKGFWGDPTLLKELATFFNAYFHPQIPVIDKHISLAPGVAHTIDTILYNVCNEGDGILCPGPYWNGYDTYCRLRAGVNPVLVECDSLSDEASFVKRLDEAFAQSSYPIKGLLIANPHNPLGRPFSRDALAACLRFCQTKDIHFISDEVLGPFTFGAIDDRQRRPFVSALAMDLNALGVSPSRVHVLWGPSKVFAMAGPRIGCIVTQANNDLRNGLTLASFTSVSSLSILLTKELLTSPTLPEIIAAYKARSLESYHLMTGFLERLGLPYQECNTGSFVLVKVAPHAQSWEDEAAVVERLIAANVWVSPGRAYHLPGDEKGWARISFALKPEVLQIGLQRIEAALSR